MYQLAEVLHKTVSEIEDMPVAEFNGWMAYFKRKREAP